jgi:hypothetical protein
MRPGRGATRGSSPAVGLDVAGDDLGREAVEPLAFRVAEEPDGLGDLLQGLLAPWFSQTKGFQEVQSGRVGDAKTRAIRFSETVLGMNFRQ